MKKLTAIITGPSPGADPLRAWWRWGLKYDLILIAEGLCQTEGGAREAIAHELEHVCAQGWALASDICQEGFGSNPLDCGMKL